MQTEELKQAEKLEVIPVELPISFDDVKEFRETGCIVSIQPPNICRKNKQLIRNEGKEGGVERK